MSQVRIQPTGSTEVRVGPQQPNGARNPTGTFKGLNENSVVTLPGIGESTIKAFMASGFITKIGEGQFIYQGQNLAAPLQAPSGNPSAYTPYSPEEAAQIASTIVDATGRSTAPPSGFVLEARMAAASTYGLTDANLHDMGKRYGLTHEQARAALQFLETSSSYLNAPAPTQGTPAESSEPTTAWSAAVAATGTAAE